MNRYLLVILFFIFDFDGICQLPQYFVSNDVFQSGYFIENKGQVRDSNKKNLTKYVLEHKGMHIDFKESELIFQLAKIVNKGEAKEKAGEEETEANRRLLQSKIVMKWIGANKHPAIETSNISSHYFSYGDFSCKGFKKITYKDVYKGIDVEYLISEKGCFKYSIIAEPNADISKIKYSYNGKQIKVVKLNNEILIVSNFDTLFETELNAKFEDTVVSCDYVLKKNELSFRVPKIVNKKLVIDPYIGNLTSLAANGICSNIGYDVDYDDKGNLYVYGGGGVYTSAENCKIAKYNPSGNLLWTFMGNIPSINWNSRGEFGQPSNFAVKKTTEEIFCGQITSNVAMRLVRLNNLGLYDNFVTTPNTQLKEVWDIQMNTSGFLTTLGGTINDKYSLALIDTNQVLAPKCVTGLNTFQQDIVCGAFDPQDNLYLIFNSNSLTSTSTPILNNRLLKLIPPYTSYDWSSLSGLNSFDEARNKPYLFYNPSLNGKENSGGFNGLYANQNYLFYYDGKNLKAFSLTDGSQIGTSLVISNYQPLYQGGIVADSCNNIFVGGNNGNIKVYQFDGINFNPQADIVLSGFGGKSVLDLKYSKTLNVLYFSGVGLVGMVNPNVSCIDTSLLLLVDKNCNGQVIVSVQNYLPNSKFNYTWTDNTTGSTVKFTSNSTNSSDTITGLLPNTSYSISAVANNNFNSSNSTSFVFSCASNANVENKIVCFGSSYRGHTSSGTYRDTLSTISGDSIIILHLIFRAQKTKDISLSICTGDSVFFKGSFKKNTGVFRDTILTSDGCDSIITLNLNVATKTFKSLVVSICKGNSYFFNGRYLTQDGNYRDTLRNVLGCDSVITELALSFFQQNIPVLSLGICPNASVTYRDSIFNMPGSYDVYFKSPSGCDSMVNVQVIQVNSQYVSISKNICKGDTFLFGSKKLFKSGTYTDTIRTLNTCDTIVVLSLVVSPPISATFFKIICNGSTFFFGGQNLSVSGVYRDTIKTFQGCDSISVLNLSVVPFFSRNISVLKCKGLNSFYDFYGKILYTAGTYKDTIPGVNCDTVVTLTLNFYGNITTQINQTICSNEYYNFGGAKINLPGSYSQGPFKSVLGCDSFVNLNLSVSTFSSYNITDTICQGTSYLFAGKNLTNTGVYRDTFQSVKGCDSITTLNLVVKSNLNSTITDTICQGTSYLFAGKNLTNTGVYRDTFQSVKGCDSITTLNLVVKSNLNSTITDTICQGSSYLFGGKNLTNTGVYRDTSQSVKGCDSITTLNLVVKSNLNSTITDTICQGTSYLFAGKNLTNTGVYRDTFQSVKGCDSITTLNLVVKSNLNSTITDTICQGSSYLFGGKNLTNTGVYRDTSQSVKGCDSITTLNLVVKSNLNSTITDTICQGSSYLFGGKNLTNTGVYRDTFQSIKGCDSITTLNLVVKTKSPSFFNAYSSYCSGSNIPSLPTISLNGITGNWIPNIIDNTKSQSYKFIADFNQCASDTSMVIEIYNSVLATKSIKVCPNELYKGNFFQRDTILVDTLQSKNGCDSIVIDNVTVNDTNSISELVSICAGDIYQNHLYNEDTVLIYHLKNINNCDSNYVVNLNILPRPIIIAEKDTAINIGEEVELTVKGGVKYIWSNGSIDSIIYVSPFETTIYVVSLTDSNGCSNSDSVLVKVYNSRVVIPNSFSPNMDDKNDYFYPVFLGQEKVSSMHIFNRWGELVFDGVMPWDGTFEGELQPSGLYTYSIIIESFDSKKKSNILRNFVGSIFLIR